MANTTSESGQGIILIFFQTPESSGKFPKTFEDWLHREYVPALSASTGIEAAWLYIAADAAYNKQISVVCRVSDLALVKAETLSTLARNGRIAPPEELASGSMETELRIYSFVQLYATSKKDQGKLHTIHYILDNCMLTSIPQKPPLSSCWP
jgi:hypothetical protein